MFIKKFYPLLPVEGMVILGGVNPAKNPVNKKLDPSDKVLRMTAINERRLYA